MNYDEIKKQKDYTEHRQNEINQNYISQQLFHSLFCFKLLQPPFCTSNSSKTISSCGLSQMEKGWEKVAASLGFLSCWKHLLETDSEGVKV